CPPSLNSLMLALEAGAVRILGAQPRAATRLPTLHQNPARRGVLTAEQQEHLTPGHMLYWMDHLWDMHADSNGPTLRAPPEESTYDNAPRPAAQDAGAVTATVEAALVVPTGSAKRQASGTPPSYSSIDEYLPFSPCSNLSSARAWAHLCLVPQHLPSSFLSRRTFRQASLETTLLHSASVIPMLLHVRTRVLLPSPFSCILLRQMSLSQAAPRSAR
ncbi:hypothetical protein CYMTET_27594, partial [Cymbomonas tetramitiformis]